ncbi:MAG: hypothetical protein IID41_10920, partial [Planctomycetes bacterium]|nr:hypothetical protein [Planctomycetota bacterium]
MSNFGRKMSTPGWCTFALLGGVLAVAFGAFANASTSDKSEATLVPAAEKAAAFTMVDHAAAFTSKREAASSTNKKRSLPTALSEVQAGSSASLSTAQPGAASAASLTEAQQPRGNKPGTLSGMSLIPDATRSAMGGGVDWDDDFESYPDGNCMHGDGGWEGWDNNSTWDACLQEVTWHSSNSAVDVSGNADLVRVYSAYTSGVWNYCTWQFIPNNFSGESFFILLNSYPAFNWSTQISFDSATGLVESEFEGATLPMITGQWVQLCVEIDLDADTQTITYDGVLLSLKSWTEGVSGGGAVNIGAVDLFANGASSIYYDDFTLIEKEGADCGDGNCDPGEDCDNCPGDCGGPCKCGNGDVEPGEDCDPPGSLCANGEFCEADCTCPGLGNDACA